MACRSTQRGHIDPIYVEETRGGAIRNPLSARPGDWKNNP